MPKEKTFIDKLSDLFGYEHLTDDDRRILKLAKEHGIDIQFVPGPTIYGSIGHKGIIDFYYAVKRETENANSR